MLRQTSDRESYRKHEEWKSRCSWNDWRHTHSTVTTISKLYGWITRFQLYMNLFRRGFFFWFSFSLPRFFSYFGCCCCCWSFHRSLVRGLKKSWFIMSHLPVLFSKVQFEIFSMQWNNILLLLRVLRGNQVR